MVAHRVMSPNYLGIGLAVATGLAANLGSSLQAQAQVNPNIQTQLNIFSPPVTSLPLGVATPTQADRLFVKLPSGKTICASTNDPEVRKILREKGVAQPKETMGKEQITKFLEEYYKENRVKAAFPQIKIHLDCPLGQPTQIKFTLPFNPTYETNTLKTGNNSSPGESAGFGGSFLVTGGNFPGRPYDLIAFGAGETSVRYAPNFSPSFDSISQQALYQMFLHADGYSVDGNGRKTFVPDIVPSTPPTQAQPGLTTFTTLAFGFQNQTAFSPTFKLEKTDFLTPQATLGWQNIGLDDPSAKACTNSNGDSQFCTYANVSLTAGQSFSDVRSLENVNLAAAGTIGWQPDHTNWNLSLQGTATGKSYEHVPGGRRDLLVQIGPNVAYAMPITIAQQKALLTLSLPVTYYRNYSNIAVDAWSGWIVMPTLNISLTYPSG